MLYSLSFKNLFQSNGATSLSSPLINPQNHVKSPYVGHMYQYSTSTGRYEIFGITYACDVRHMHTIAEKVEHISAKVFHVVMLKSWVCFKCF